MRHRGLAVHAFKATGVSLRRDILAMEDAGARRSQIFTDFGIVTTTAASGPALTRTMLTEMTQGKPDVVVFELGDGILGAYGVEAILSAPDIARSLTAVILSANDPVAAWGGVKLLRERFSIEPCAVTGPATDNAVGVNIIEQQMQVRAFNAITAGAALGDHIIDCAGPRGAARGGGQSMSARDTRDRAGRHRLRRRRTAAPARDRIRTSTWQRLPPTASPTNRSRSSSGTCSPCCRTCASRATKRSSSTSRRTRRRPCSRRRRTACRPALIDRLLTAAEQAGTQARVVDISADFRYASADAYEAVYKHAHGAPDRHQRVHAARCPST